MGPSALLSRQKPSKGRKSSTANKVTPKFISDEYVADSDEEGELDGATIPQFKGSTTSTEEHNRKNKRKTHIIKSIKDRVGERTENEGDETEGSTDKSQSENPKNLANGSKNIQTRRQKSKTSAGLSSSESSSEASGGHTESQSEEDERDTLPQSAQTTLLAQASGSAFTSTAIEPTPYEPPSGFRLLTSASSSSLQTLGLLSRSSLKNKQLWHITAPPSVPIGLVQELSTESIRGGKVVLSYNKSDYEFKTCNKRTQDEALLLIPDGTDDLYKAASLSFEHTLHLQQQLGLQDFSKIHTTSQITKVPIKKPTCSQPEGLKLRFLPFGTAHEDLTVMDSTSSPSKHSTRINQVLKHESPRKRHRHHREHQSHSEVESSTISSKQYQHLSNEAEDSSLDIEIIDLSEAQQAKKLGSVTESAQKKRKYNQGHVEHSEWSETHSNLRVDHARDHESRLRLNGNKSKQEQTNGDGAAYHMEADQARKPQERKRKKERKRIEEAEEGSVFGNGFGLTEPNSEKGIKQEVQTSQLTPVVQMAHRKEKKRREKDPVS